MQRKLYRLVSLYNLLTCHIAPVQCPTFTIWARWSDSIQPHVGHALEPVDLWTTVGLPLDANAAAAAAASRASKDKDDLDSRILAINNMIIIVRIISTTVTRLPCRYHDNYGAAIGPNQSDLRWCLKVWLVHRHDWCHNKCMRAFCNALRDRFVLHRHLHQFTSCLL